MIGILSTIAMLVQLTTSTPPLVVQDAMKSNEVGPAVVVTNHTGYNTSGFLAVVSNPINHFRVLYPHQPNNETCAGYILPSVAAKKYKCAIATNGSPFTMEKNPITGTTCLGDVVTAGSIVVSTPSVNAFGMTADNKFVIGEITDARIKSLNVTELLSGFNWLVEQGSVSSNLQPGGEIAPRTLIGTDVDGRLILFVANGIEDKNAGLTMLQAAQWIKTLGGYNVINLDGGGSSTFVKDGKIYNHPTCVDTPAECQRPVTTVPCVF